MEAARGEAEIHTGAEIAHLGCGLVHLGEAAYRAGRVINFDPETETVVGDDEADALLTKDYREPFGL